MKRDLEGLEKTEFDLVIIGGGIQGAGIAREAVLQGLTTLLVDRSDFASGTSSRSTKLIHGGLRYLEHGNFKLVREALTERRAVMSLTPHLVRPLGFILPSFKTDRRPLWQIRIGLGLYDYLARGSGFLKYEKCNSEQVLSQFPDLKSNGLQGGCLYWDAVMNDARLCLEVLKAASELGGRVLNYMRVLEFQKTDGKISGIKMKDLKSGQMLQVSGKVFVNAGGVWCDELRQLAEPGKVKRIRLSKGIHVVTRRLFSSKESKEPLALIAPTKDGRVFFVIPWIDETTLIGTTDTEYTGKPSECYAKREDVEYLLGQMQCLFPDLRLKRRDIDTTFSGLRALVDSSKGSSANLSREYVIETLDSGLISILGGKYTTFRSLAGRVVKQVLEGLKVTGRYEDTSLLSLGGLTLEDEEDLKKGVDLDRQSKFHQLSSELKDHLWRTYGSHTLEIFKLLDYDPSLKEGVLKDRFPIKAEVVYAIKDEMILTLTDYFRRRSQLFFSPGGGLDFLDAVAKVYQDYLHWSDEEIEKQKQAYRQEIEKNTKVLDQVKF